MTSYDINNKATMIWSIADKLRDVYKPHEYGLVILPFTVMRRFDCVLADTKKQVLETYERVKDLDNPEIYLTKASGHAFYNTSKFTFETLLGDPTGLENNLRSYIGSFSPNVRDILTKFDIDAQIGRMANKRILFEVVAEFASNKNDLSPEVVSDIDMGYIFEEIIRRFSESYNEDAGQHYTPREVIALMSSLLFRKEDQESSKGIIRSIYDPACGTGGMLSVAQEYISEVNDKVRLLCYGEELNDETYAICKADLLIKGTDTNGGEHIYCGNTLSDDAFPNEKFNYIISNPPFGTDWKTVKDDVEAEAKRGSGGRFGQGLPSISDGQMLFLSAAVAKMKSSGEGGGRVAIIHNGSPLFTGDAGSGPSEIRKYLIENDLLEAVIALPEDLFYNTGIGTYLWILDNSKSAERKGKVQLIDARQMFSLRRKSVGKKRVDIDKESLEAVKRAYLEFKNDSYSVANKVCESKVFDNIEFGYTKVVVESPLLDNNGNPILTRGKMKADKDKRDSEDIPLKEDIEEYLEREVRPYNPDAWIDGSKSKVGYAIQFTRYFYKYVPPRSSEEILAEVKQLEGKIADLMKQLE